MKTYRSSEVGGEFYNKLREATLLLGGLDSKEVTNFVMFCRGCKLSLVPTVVLEKKIKTMIGIDYNFLIELMDVYGSLHNRDIRDDVCLNRTVGVSVLSGIISVSVEEELMESELSKSSPLLIDIILMFGLHKNIIS